MSRKPTHRKPAMPHREVPKGRCCWCGDFIWKKNGELNTRRHWHPHCVDAYKEAAWPQYARRKVFRRDKGVCAACGCASRRTWELDHIVPLIDGGGFELENMQTLCKPCHRLKTGQEASLRAERRRATADVPESALPQPGETESNAWLDLPFWDELEQSYAEDE